MSNDSVYKSSIHKVGDEFFYKSKFNIPVYQRLYVWEELQVKTLIDDLIGAYKNDENNDYYLGGIIVTKRGGKDEKYNLIDGQQRFTTLKFLLETLTPDKDSATHWHLTFDARPEGILDIRDVLDNNANEDVCRMIRARDILRGRLDSLGDEEGFRTYLKCRVQMAVTEIPRDADLNKIFELVNGRGTQLLQHQILKAKILERVDVADRNIYGQVWDACAQMNSFLVHNLKRLSGKKWGVFLNALGIRANSKITIDFERYCEHDAPPTNEGNNSSIGESETELTIQDICAGTAKNGTGNNGANGEDNEHDEVDDGNYQSIISFPTFLLYVLASGDKNAKSAISEFLNDTGSFTLNEKSIEFKETNLLAIFGEVLLKNADANKSAAFIKKLFTYRQAFDDWVIKDCLTSDNTRIHARYEIQREEKNGTKINSLDGDEDGNGDSNGKNKGKALSLLQSMLYHSHSRAAQEWLIPFLTSVVGKNTTDTDTDAALKQLRAIDNALYSAIDKNNNIEGTVLKRALESPTNTVNAEKVKEYLGQSLGTKFARYWFYKLDWIIWWCDPECCMSSDKSNFKDFKLDFKEFRFTSRNSIEHIHPQNPRPENQSSDIENLDNFGNLALVSRGRNSALSNKGFEEKKGHFKDPKYQSRNNLKMSLIFQNETWTQEALNKHRDLCLDLIEKYFSEQS